MKNLKPLIGATLCALIAAAYVIPAKAIGPISLKGITDKLPGRTSAPSGDIDSLVNAAAEADAMVSGSADYLFKAVGNKQEVEKYRERMKVAKEIKDPKEQKAEIHAIQSDMQTNLQKTLALQETENLVKNMRGEQLKNFGTAAYSFLLGMMKDQEIISAGQALMQGLSGNPAMLLKAAPLKDALSSATNQVKAGAKISQGLVKLAKAGKLDIMPKSASDKPKEIPVL